MQTSLLLISLVPRFSVTVFFRAGSLSSWALPAVFIGCPLGGDSAILVREPGVASLPLASARRCRVFFISSTVFRSCFFPRKVFLSFCAPWFAFAVFWFPCRRPYWGPGQCLPSLHVPSTGIFLYGKGWDSSSDVARCRCRMMIGSSKLSSTSTATLTCVWSLVPGSVAMMAPGSLLLKCDAAPIVFS